MSRIQAMPSDRVNRSLHGASFVLRFSFFVLGVSFFVLATVACDDGPTLTPTPPPAPIVTDTFSGVLGKSSGATHNFNAAGTGNITATLVAVGPDAQGGDGTPLVVGFGMGTWNGLSCTVVIAQDRAIQGSILVGQVNASGPLCVRVFDVGNVPDQVDYTIRVDHP
jgi:hypothetical protein